METTVAGEECTSRSNQGHTHTPSLPSTSQGDENKGEEKKADDDDMKVDPWIPFECSLCHMAAKCYFRQLRCSDGFYPSEVYFMRDPFTRPPRVRGRKPVLADFVVLGSLCSICQQPVCLSKSCSLYFGAHFCASCVQRERRRFPEKLVEQVVKAQAAAAQKDEATNTSEVKNKEKKEKRKRRHSP